MIRNDQKQNRLKINTLLIILIIISILGMLIHTLSIFTIHSLDRLTPDGIETVIVDLNYVNKLQLWLAISGLFHLLIIIKSINALINPRSINSFFLSMIFFSCISLLINTFYYPAFVIMWLWLVFLIIYILCFAIFSKEISSRRASTN